MQPDQWLFNKNILSTVVNGPTADHRRKKPACSLGKNPLGRKGKYNIDKAISPVTGKGFVTILNLFPNTGIKSLDLETEIHIIGRDQRMNRWIRPRGSIAR